MGDHSYRQAQNKRTSDGYYTPDAYYKRNYGKTKFSDLSREQVEKAYEYNQAFLKDHPEYENDHTILKINQRYEDFAAERRQEEFMGMMGEYMGMMSEAMNKVTPAQEPLKSASDQMSFAADDVGKKQQMRNGLLSLTRFDQGTTKLGV